MSRNKPLRSWDLATAEIQEIIEIFMEKVDDDEEFSGSDIEEEFDVRMKIVKEMLVQEIIEGAQS